MIVRLSFVATGDVIDRDNRDDRLVFLRFSVSVSSRWLALVQRTSKTDGLPSRSTLDSLTK